MSQMPICISTSARLLKQRQMKSGGWAYFGCTQESVEPTCLATLALASMAQSASVRGMDFLQRSQLACGGWPVFRSDEEASWMTALALSTAVMMNIDSNTCEPALQWLLLEKGYESHWLWRWKFKTADRRVRFDTDKYGWPWSPGSCSWVIPTAFALVAIKQFTVCHRTAASEKRIRIGVEMLLDRACVGGGWNAGNSVVYGIALKPHVEATAIALLALQDEPRSDTIQRGLDWLWGEASTVESISSLAWSILTLFVYQQSIQNLKERLARLTEDGSGIGNNATLATAILALRCGEMIHPFLVLR